MKGIFEIYGVSKAATVLISSALVVGAGGGTMVAADTVQKNNMIDESAAVSFAYLDAGVDASAVVDYDVELEREGLSYVYEVEFRTSDTKYSYEINPKDGTVMETESEIITKTDFQDTQSETGTLTTSYISVDEAKNIALNAVGLSFDQVTFTKVKLEKENGVVVYEVEFYTANKEYEFSINAATGKIIETDIEDENTEYSYTIDGQNEGNTSSDTSSDTQEPSSVISDDNQTSSDSLEEADDDEDESDDMDDDKSDDIDDDKDDDSDDDSDDADDADDDEDDSDDDDSDDED